MKKTTYKVIRELDGKPVIEYECSNGDEADLFYKSLISGFYSNEKIKLVKTETTQSFVGRFFNSGKQKTKNTLEDEAMALSPRMKPTKEFMTKVLMGEADIKIDQDGNAFASDLTLEVETNDSYMVIRAKDRDECEMFSMAILNCGVITLENFEIRLGVEFDL